MSVATSYGPAGSETGLLMCERAFKRDGTKTGVIYSHGAGADGSSAMDQTEPGLMLYPLINQGYPVVSMDMGGAYTWGNDTAAAKMTNAVSQLAALGANTAKVALVGASMGSLTTLCSILKGTLTASQIAVVALFVGIPNLAAFHDNNRGGFASSVETAYGGLAGYNVAVAGHDPSQHPSAFSGIRIRFWNGTADTTAVLADAQSFAAAVGSNVDVISVSGGTHASTIPAVAPSDFTSYLMPYL